MSAMSESAECRVHPQPRPAIGVVGCGLMGAGIAEVCTRAGLDVVVREIDAAAAERGRSRVLTSLDRGVTSGKLSEAERDAARRAAHVHHRLR